MEKLMELYSASLQKNQILVFRSNINTNKDATFVCSKLLKIDGIYSATIDLEDWENILRLEGSSSLLIHEIKKIINNLGFECSELK